MFKLLEHECHKLDLKLALTSGASNLPAGQTFEDYVAAQGERRLLEEKLESSEREIDETAATATWFTLHLPDAETNTNLATLFQEIENMKKEKELIVSEVKGHIELLHVLYMYMHNTSCVQMHVYTH